MVAPAALSDFEDDDHYVKTSATSITPSEDPLSLQDLMNAICLISDLLIPHGMCLIT